MDPNTLSLEQRTVKKVTLRILPYVFLLYIIASIDRANFGYAALTMNKELGLSAEVFGLLSGIFFLPYFLAEVPSNLLLKRIGPRIWIARILVTWGIITMLTAFAQTSTHLYILRFLLGLAEAGFFPGIAFYLTYWFRSKEKARAYAILVMSVPVAGFIGAPISTWILDHISWLGLAGWKWMFILEGIPAVIFGIINLFYMSNNPKVANWLTNEEKEWLEKEIESERNEVNKAGKNSIKESLKQPALWKLSLMYFFFYGAVYGLAFWLPSIIKGLSGTLSNTSIGWLTMIPNLAAIPAMILWGRHSDLKGERRNHMIISLLIAAIGFLGCGFTTNPFIAVTMLTIANMGLFSMTGVFWPLLGLYFSETSAAFGFAFVNAIGALGGFFGPMVYGYFKLNSAMFTIAILLFIGMFVVFTLKQRGGNPMEESQNMYEKV